MRTDQSDAHISTVTVAHGDRPVQTKCDVIADMIPVCVCEDTCPHSVTHFLIMPDRHRISVSKFLLLCMCVAYHKELRFSYYQVWVLTQHCCCSNVVRHLLTASDSLSQSLMPPAYQHCWHFHYINVSVYVSVFRKGVSEDRVSLEDREHAKRIVYSVVYGAGENCYP